MLSPRDLSDNFTWEEAVVTTHRDIPNELPAELKNNVKMTAMKMETIRYFLRCPVSVLSWYRCELLNRKVGGAKNSDHMTGTAVDFAAYKYGTPLAIVKLLANYADMLAFKQLILEHTWAHISFDPTPGIPAKREVLTLLQDKTYARGITDKYGVAVV
jgi:hypothetical protein